MLLPLTYNEVLVVPFDAHRHEPLAEQISMLLGFDGVSHLVTESISQRMINKALENLVETHHPFAFGIINIDNYATIISNFDESLRSGIAEMLLDSIDSELGAEDITTLIDDNEFATILFCRESINEVFPRLWALSNLSNTPFIIEGKEVMIHFSAGYVLVTDPYTTAKEVLDEAISMMYKSKGNGKNGYYLSDTHHSANDPSL